MYQEYCCKLSRIGEIHCKDSNVACVILLISFILQIWTVLFLAVVMASIGILCIETVPKLRVPIKDLDHMYEKPTITPPDVEVNGTIHKGTPQYDVNSTDKISSDFDWNDNDKIKWLLTTVPHPALENIDSFCTCFFTIEFIVRFVVAPNKKKFWTSIMNIIDVLCVLPMWIKYIMQLYNVRMNIHLLPVFFIIMMLRVLRICRVLRLARHYTGVKILLLALKASFKELGMLVIFVFIVVLIFAVVIYYAEFFQNDTFSTIPDGYWWAIITLTTVRNTHSSNCFSSHF